MCRPSCRLLCAILMFGICSSAYARGGTYHHADFIPLKSIETAKKPLNATVHHRHRSHQRVAIADGLWPGDHTPANSRDLR